MTPSLLILACSATKRADPAPLPALQRYDGPGWRVLRKALAERPGLVDRLTVVALSAEFGLVPAAFPLPVYDRRMDAERAAELCPQVTGALGFIGGPWKRVRVEVGPAYRLALPEPFPWTATWACGSIGVRLHCLKEWLWEV